MTLITGLSAQEIRSRLVGKVTDSSGAAIPSLIVRATNTATGVTTPATTSGSGDYDIPYLLPGPYTVSVETAGFKRYERSGLQLRAGDQVRIDVQLEVGAVAESVNVTAATPLLQSESASTGQVIEQKRIVDLPLSGGNAFTLTRLAPGVSNFAQVNHNSFASAPQVMSRISISGSPQSTTEFTVDGVPVMSRNEASFVPPADIVQEFRVETNSYDAGVGRSSGGNVNVTLRSGTNQLHGTAYEFNSTDDVRGIDFFQRRTLYDPATGPVTRDKRKAINGHSIVNRFGGTLSGPVYLPKVYDGRNRSFFLYGYEAIIRPTIATGNYFSTVPTVSQRNGDFSDLLRLGNQYQIYDPSTIRAQPGGRFGIQPLPGNVIPANRIDPTAKRLLDFWPLPNVPGTVDGRNNFFLPYPVRDEFSTHNARFDHNFSSRHRTFLRYNQTQYIFDTDRYFPTEATGVQWDRPYKSAAIDHVFVATPAFLVNARYGLSRNVLVHRPYSQNFDLASLGFSPRLAEQIDPRGLTFPRIDIDQYRSIGTSSPNGLFTTYHTGTVNLTTLKSRHSFRYGVEFRDYTDSNYDLAFATPGLTFGSTYTRGPLDNSPAAPIGQGLASFLLGIPTSGQVRQPINYTERSRYWAAYFHDDFRVTTRLTLNLGLRYDYNTPPVERFDRTVRGFDPTTASPLDAAARARYAASPMPDLPADRFRVMGGLTFAGLNGQPRRMWDADRNNFAPRIGAALKITNNTVVRGGYGIFYSAMGVDQANVNQTGFIRNIALVPSRDNGVTFSASLRDPFPQGIAFPTSQLDLLTNAGQSVTAFSANMPNPLLHRWSVDVQRELPGQFVVSLGYVGSSGRNLTLNREINGVPAQYLSRSPVRDQPVIDALTRVYPNPFGQQLAGTALAGQNLSRAQLLRPFPQFTSVAISETAGSSNYNSLQTAFEKRYSKGITLQGSYTWSKFMSATGFLNDIDPNPERVVSSLDRPHRLSVSGLWELPFGPGRAIGGSMRGVAGALLGGWQLQAVYEAQSGGPLGFGNAILNGTIDDVAAGKQAVDRWFNTAPFERTPARQLANNVRALSSAFGEVRSHGVNIWNASGMKVFRIGERVRLQFRTELLNAFNHTHFSPPNTTPVNSLFGQVTNSTSRPREIYFALKLIF